ncbi:MAG: TolC family protein [Candidatus Cryptobacteroides sp.]
MKHFKLYIIMAMLSISAATYAQPRLSLSLEQCKTMSGENDADLKNAGLDVNSAKALKREALTEYFPNVSLNGFGYYAFNPLLKIGLKDILGSSDGAQNIIDAVEAAAPLYGISTTASFLDYGYSASASLTQPVYAGGRIVNGNKLAEINLQAALLKQASASRDKSVDVEEKYWKAVSLEEKMISLQQALKTVDTLGRDVRNACLAGLALDTDTLKVNLERNKILSTMTQVRSGIRLAKMDLFNAIGQDYSYISSLATESAPWIDDILLSDRPENLPAPDSFYVDENEAASKSEESQLLSLNVESSRLQKKIALGEALPQVGIGVGYGYGRLVGESGRWNGAVYAMVKIPLTDYWKASCKMSRMENEAIKAENQRDYLNSQLVLQMHKLWEDVTCSYEQMGIAEEAVALGEINESRTLNRYRSGQATVSDVLSAQTELRLAQDELTDARIKYSIALSAYKAKSAVCRRQ